MYNLYYITLWYLASVQKPILFTSPDPVRTGKGMWSAGTCSMYFLSYLFCVLRISLLSKYIDYTSTTVILKCMSLYKQTDTYENSVFPYQTIKTSLKSNNLPSCNTLCTCSNDKDSLWRSPMFERVRCCCLIYYNHRALVWMSHLNVTAVDVNLP